MNASITVIMLIGLVAMALVIIALAVWVVTLSGRVRRLSDMFIDFQTKSQTSVQVRQLSAVQHPEALTIEQVQNTVAQARAEHEEQVQAAQAIAKSKKVQHASAASRGGHGHAHGGNLQGGHAQTQGGLTQGGQQGMQSQGGVGHVASGSYAAAGHGAGAGQYAAETASVGAAGAASAAGHATGSYSAVGHAGNSYAASQATGQYLTRPSSQYAFDADDEDDNDFFEGYRHRDPSETSGGRRKTPSIPFGKDKDKIDKQESYVRDAVDNDFDPDSIDFSRVAGYKNRLKSNPSLALKRLKK